MGHGVTEDHKEAVRWWRLAAKRGYAAAQINLGLMYNLGYGVTEDYKEAVRLFRLAAEDGNRTVQFDLGMMYAEGRGVVMDPVMAYVLVNVSRANGHPKAIKFLGEFGDKTLAKLNASERKLVVKLSKLCLDKPASCPEYIQWRTYHV